MQKMTYDTLNNSITWAMTQSRKAEAALLEVAGPDFNKRLIHAIGTVFAGLVKDGGLEEASTYRFKQGWKLAANYDLDGMISTHGIDETGEFCDFIECRFRQTVLTEIEARYRDQKGRKDEDLKFLWEVFGYHAEEEAKIAA